MLHLRQRCNKEWHFLIRRSKALYFHREYKALTLALDRRSSKIQDIRWKQRYTNYANMLSLLKRSLQDKVPKDFN